MSLHRIMVVDDNADMLAIYSRVLVQEGFEVFSAATGVECLEQIETITPEIFLMDVVLPDWNGIDLVKEIKGRPQFTNSIFVLLSGLMTDSENRIKGLDAGAVDYMARPIPNKELVAKIKSLIKVMDFQESLISLSSQLEQRVKDRTAELEETIDSLRKSEDNHRSIIETAMDGYWLVDSAGRLLEVNETYCRMSGYSRQELLSMHVSDLESNESVHETNAHIQKVAVNGEDRFETRHICKDGRVIDIEISVQYRPVDGGQFVTFLRDITERKQNFDQLTDLSQRLQHAQKMESMGRLVGGVAHDFNNILTAILGYSHIGLLKTDPSEKPGIYFDEIRKAAERSCELTKQLLTFARKHTSEPKVLNLNETVSGMLKMLQRLIGEDIALAWQNETDLWKVRIDPSQIDQILANLCVNARDAISDNGKITIEVGNASFSDDYCAKNSGFEVGDFVRMSVIDNGHGIDHKSLLHIFEPYFTTKGVGVGTGLGLATVHGIVKQSGGFIHVYSKPEVGSTFSVYLPRYHGEDSAVRSSSINKSIPRGHETFLLVDDDSTILDLTSQFLLSLGYTILVANAPSVALRMAEEENGVIDLLITDVVMPEMNGLKLADKLQSLYPHIKCLYMSGYTDDVIGRLDITENCRHFIQKPFSLPDLAQKIRSVLDD